MVPGFGAKLRCRSIFIRVVYCVRQRMYREFKKRFRTFKNWWRFIPPCNRARHNVVARLRDGTKILIRDIRSDDYTTLMDMACGDMYLLFEIKKPSIIVARRFPNATVYAIEPDTENYQALLQNIALNGLKNISPLNAAVAGEYGSTPLYTSPSSVAHSTVDATVGAETKMVDTIPLSKFPHIDVLKFDAEGAEYVVKEIPRTSYLAIEIHNIAGQDTGKLEREVMSKFHIIKKDVGKSGHITLVGVGG